LRAITDAFAGRGSASRTEAVDRGRADAAARRRAAEDDRIDLLLSRIEARFVPKNPTRPSSAHRLVVARLEPRVDLDPVTAT